MLTLLNSAQFQNCHVKHHNFSNSAKKSEVSLNFTVFMKQKNMCFTNWNFELPREVGVKLSTYIVH
jgi:hypothetical protein